MSYDNDFSREINDMEIQRLNSVIRATQANAVELLEQGTLTKEIIEESFARLSFDV